MKNSIQLLATALLLTAVGCHEPEALAPALVNRGLNSLSAQFASGDYKNDPNAKFTTFLTDPAQERIVIDIPYFYPYDSFNESQIGAMRVSANLDDNCFITPSLGTLDLRKENWFTLTRVDGSTRRYCVTGNIKKSDQCRIEEFELPGAGLKGVIDQDTREISIIAAGTLAPSTAQYRLSYHASIAPDPAAEALDYNSAVKFTVTAYDGVTRKVYTVKKNVPGKVKSGIRAGSGTVLWEKQLFADLGISTVDMTGGMAVTDKYILLNTRNENSVIVDRATGAKVGMYELPAEVKGSLVNFYNTADRAGNILLCNLSPNAGAFRIWRIAAGLNTPPQPYIAWNGGLPVGRKISVQGNIDGEAIITAPIHTGEGKFARWQVQGGRLVDAVPDIVTLRGTTPWSDNHADIVYTDPGSPESNYFAAYYGGGNVIGCFDGKTNTLISKLTDPIGSNYVANSVDYADFNHHGYMCFSSFNGFSWGGGGAPGTDNPPATDCCWMLDANDPPSFSGNPSLTTNPIYVLQSKEYRSRAVSNGGVPNGNTTGDMAFWISPDGYFLYMYMLITNGQIVAWQFDCIDK